MASKLTLPPGTKAQPFPASAFAAAPLASAPLAPGVEQQARMNQPAPMGFATPISDRVAALGRAESPDTNATPAVFIERQGTERPQMVPDFSYMARPGVAPAAAVNVSTMVGPAPTPYAAGGMSPASPLGGMSPRSPLGGMSPRSLLGGMSPRSPLGGMSPASPLGGMDTRGIAQRGGPMSYSQQGVGTNNPNAFAVGANRAPLGTRLLQRAARRRDPRAILALANMEQQNTQMGQQFGMMQMREAADAQRFDQQQQNQMTMFERQQQAMQQRDAVNFQQQQQMFDQETQRRAGESATEFKRRQEAEAAERAAQSVVGAEQLNMPGGMVPIVRNADGTTRLAGSFMPTRETVPPLTPDDLAAARAMGGDVTMRVGDAQINLPGMAAQGAGKAPSFTYEKDPNGRITGAVYPVQDPQTGQWKLQRADLNGDGVISADEAAAAAPAGAAAGAASAAQKTKAGNSYTLK